MSGIGQLYRSKADDDKKSLQAAAFGKVTSEIRNLDEAVANLQRFFFLSLFILSGFKRLSEDRLANDKGITEEPKWASRFTNAVNTASKHIDELYSRVDQLDADLSNFMRLFLADIKKELINVPVQKKAENGRPLETMPHQKVKIDFKTVCVHTPVLLKKLHLSKKGRGKEKKETHSDARSFCCIQHGTWWWCNWVRF
jgi:hypothetical protein